MRENPERLIRENEQLRVELSQQYASDQRLISDPREHNLEVNQRTPPTIEQADAHQEVQHSRGSVFECLWNYGGESHANSGARRESYANSGPCREPPEPEKEASPPGSTKYYQALLDKVIADVVDLKNPHKNAITPFAGTVDSPLTAEILAELVLKH